MGQDKKGAFARFLRGRNGTADRASCCGRPTERRGRRRSVRKCTPKRAVYWPRTKREVCYGALLPRVTTTTTTTYCEHHLSILPYHSAGCPSADKGATERNRRRNTRGGEKTVVWRETERVSRLCTRTDDRNFAPGYAPPRGTRSSTGVPTIRWTMGRPTIERIGVDIVGAVLHDVRRVGERSSCARSSCSSIYIT